MSKPVNTKTKSGAEIIPNHVAMILDGNRRWAEVRRVAPWKGHEQGSETVRKILRASLKLKIKNLSMWGSSLDNIQKRSPEEVFHLLDIFKRKFKELAETDDVHRERVRINILGRWRELFPTDVAASMEKAVSDTKDYSNHFLNFFIAYSGTDEILAAVKGIVDKSKTDPSYEVSGTAIKENLFTKNLPPVDYLIRTGGNPHLSNGFMMWDTQDAQLYFSDKLWPDFTGVDFNKAIKDYGKRIRKFGA